MAPTLPLNPLEHKFPTTASICCQVHSRLRSGDEEEETKDENKKRDGRRSVPGQNNGGAFRSPPPPPSSIAAVLIAHLSLPLSPSVGQLTRSHTWHLLRKNKKPAISHKRTQRCQGALHSASIAVSSLYIYNPPPVVRGGKYKAQVQIHCCCTSVHFSVICTSLCYFFFPQLFTFTLYICTKIFVLSSSHIGKAHLHLCLEVFL